MPRTEMAKTNKGKLALALGAATALALNALAVAYIYNKSFGQTSGRNAGQRTMGVAPMEPSNR